MKNELEFKRERPSDGIHDDVVVNRSSGSLPVVVYIMGAFVVTIAAVAFFITEVVV